MTLDFTENISGGRAINFHLEMKIVETVVLGAPRTIDCCLVMLSARYSEVVKIKSLEKTGLCLVRLCHSLQQL